MKIEQVRDLVYEVPVLSYNAQDEDYLILRTNTLQIANDLAEILRSTVTECSVKSFSWRYLYTVEDIKVWSNEHLGCACAVLELVKDACQFRILEDEYEKENRHGILPFDPVNPVPLDNLDDLIAEMTSV